MDDEIRTSWLEPYENVIRLIKEQFGLEANVEYVPCEVSGSVHYYKNSKCVYCGMVK